MRSQSRHSKDMLGRLRVEEGRSRDGVIGEPYNCTLWEESHGDCERLDHLLISTQEMHAVTLLSVFQGLVDAVRTGPLDSTATTAETTPALFTAR